MSPSGAKWWEDRAVEVLEPQLLLLRKVPLSQSFRFLLDPTATTIGLFGAWTWQNEEKERKQRRKKIRRFPPSFRTLGRPCSSPWDRTRTLFPELFVGLSAHHWVSSSFEFRPMNSRGEKLLNSLSIWRHFKVWSSSPTHLLLFTFQSPQIAAPRIPSRLYSCIQWEKQSGVCLLHLTKNQNSTPDLWAGELTCWKFRLESTVSGLTRMD